ncbi:MAG: flagellar biosynthesis anti-sigma factor FlgM [Candidatus Hydrogenedentes bacterium]|nr:flagellar biosynthesis anti-sigma factor FlgM [Candidatus Hydrogenedentota bacterium]MBI3117424.1 flagellar biosynthesis anti-sigma factor FlgM [Candidatus Hydrogenedentota bacterium]
MSIQAIQGWTEITPAQPVRARGRAEGVLRSELADVVDLSDEAKGAAEAYQYAAQADRAAEMRKAQIEAAKQRIEEGSYRMYDVVSQVAARISRFV